MTMEIYLKGQKIKVDPKKFIGKGGEADVFDIGNGLALKIFKSPDHPDFIGFPEEQAAAKERIKIHQEKLKCFPKNLPPKVISPQELALDRNEKTIVGYAMRYLHGTNPLFKYHMDRMFRVSGIDNNKILEIFKDLHGTLKKIHQVNVVIGDFNDLNVLILGKDAYIIDADSFQFGKFICPMFTARFLDPLLVPKNAKSFLPEKPHNKESDWYAFAIMLFQCLLYLDPYLGIYKPKDKARFVPHDLRPLFRITVFNPEVKYPKHAVHYSVLSDELLNYFRAIFEKDTREEFPLWLLENARWTKCANCGAEHSRASCPKCFLVPPRAIKETLSIRGNVTAITVFKTTGIILFAVYEKNGLKWLYHENNKFFREQRNEVASTPLVTNMRFRISGSKTLIAKNNKLDVFDKTGKNESINIDVKNNLPIFDANEHNKFWVSGDELLRDGLFGPEKVGEILQGQTLLWTGPKFGFGFYQAGLLNVAFIFGTELGGKLNDSIKPPIPRGKILDATCAFSEEFCWFFTTSEERGKVINRVSVINSAGTTLAFRECEYGLQEWLGQIRGKCAYGKFLFSPGEDGISRIEIENGALMETKKFPDTEPFLETSSQLFAGRDGIYAVSNKEIKLLKIN